MRFEDPSPTSDTVDTSRRRFLKLSAPALGLGLAACSTSSETQPNQAQTPAAHGSSVRFDLTRDSGALEPDQVVRSACQFCNSLCGIEVLKKSGRVIGIRGDAEDPVALGGLCVKADMMPQLVYNPHRIKTPLKRVRGRKGDRNSVFEPISWDAALDGIARKLIEIRDTTGPQGVANKTSGRLPRGTGSIIGRFFDLYGSPNATDVGPVCNDAGGNALAWTFGLGNFTNGYGIDGATGKEDLGASKFFLFLGTNQAETHPVTFEYLLRARQATGATLVVVDPRRTPTAAYADEHLAIRPHTDMALAYGMLAHIIDRELYDHANDAAENQNVAARPESDEQRAREVRQGGLRDDGEAPRDAGAPEVIPDPREDLVGGQEPAEGLPAPVPTELIRARPVEHGSDALPDRDGVVLRDLEKRLPGVLEAT